MAGTARQRVLPLSNHLIMVPQRLDSHRESDRQIGALGVTHDWSISRRIVELVQTPVILAGGLGPDNVTDAIRVVRPAGIDSKSKTDQDGSHRKDLDRVRRFHEAAEAA